MKKFCIKSVILGLLLLNLTSCGTIISLTNGDYQIYAGVQKDFQVIREGGILSVMAVVDLPLSFVVDTLVLPVTLSR